MVMCRAVRDLRVAQLAPGCDELVVLATSLAYR